MDSEKITIEKIAKLANVSKGLVSKALRGKYGVSEDMRAYITMKAVECGYDFSRLKTKPKSRFKCGLLISSRYLMKEPYWQPIIIGLESALSAKNIELDYIVYKGENPDEEENKRIINSLVDCFCIIKNNSLELLNTLSKTRVPATVIDPRYKHHNNMFYVKMSNYDSAYDLTKYLIESGHRKIAFYGANTFAESFLERYQGFCDCMDFFAGQRAERFEVLFENDDNSFSDSGSLKKLLTETPEITAIACANDLLALDAIRCVRAIGLSVPQDISVAGFDNIKEGEFSTPSLTTVNIPRRQMGEEAAKFLIDILKNVKMQYRSIHLNCELVIRETTRKLTEGTV